MSLTVKQMDAIYALYPQVIRTCVDTAYDANENEIEYDLNAVNAKAAELQAEEEAIAQVKIEAKQSAHDKLAALGLTAEEIAALGK